MECNWYCYSLNSNNKINNLLILVDKNRSFTEFFRLDFTENKCYHNEIYNKNIIPYDMKDAIIIHYYDDLDGIGHNNYAFDAVYHNE